MNNESPLVPQGSFLEQKNQGRARVKIAVFVVLAIHGIGLMALLMQGCQKAPDANSSASVEQTNTPAPPEESFAPVAPTFVEQPTNPATVVDTSTPPVVQTTGVPLTPYQEQVTPATTSNPPPLPTTSSTSLGGGTEHKIAKGDTLAALAKQHKVPLSAIQAANPGVDPSRLKIGQTIQIPPAPAASSMVTATPSTTSRVDNVGASTYRVRSGDTLLRIAKRHGITVPALQKANGLRTHRIKVGQELVIPGKNATQASNSALPSGR